MKIQLKNELFSNANFYEAIRKLTDYPDFKAKDAYALHVVVKELTAKALDFNTIKTQLMDKHGTKDDEKGVYKFTDESMPQFEADFKELTEIEFELPFEKIPYPSDLKMSVAQLAAIDGIFDFSTLE